MIMLATGRITTRKHNAIGLIIALALLAALLIGYVVLRASASNSRR